MKQLFKYGFLFLIGGAIYILMEIISRGWSHWTMFVLGGICFVAMGSLNENIDWNMPLLVQMLCGGGIITLLEFSTGCIFNLWFGWGVWDYSNEFGNLLGQICIRASFIWFFISALGIILDDYLRYWIFKEEKPRYHII